MLPYLTALFVYDETALVACVLRATKKVAIFL